MIRCIVFDLDGVLHLTEERFSRWVVKKFGLSETALLKFFENDYKLCRIGKLDIRKVIGQYLQEAGWHGSVDGFLNVWHDYGLFDSTLTGHILALRKKGIMCILATNNEPYRLRILAERHDFAKMFDHLLVSGDLGYEKPDSRVFDKILSLSHLEPSEILICDDSEGIIAAAISMGFPVHHYKGIEGFLKTIVSMDKQMLQSFPTEPGL